MTSMTLSRKKPSKGQGLNFTSIKTRGPIWVLEVRNKHIENHMGDLPARNPATTMFPVEATWHCRRMCFEFFLVTWYVHICWKTTIRVPNSPGAPTSDSNDPQDYWYLRGDHESTGRENLGRVSTRTNLDDSLEKVVRSLMNGRKQIWNWGYTVIL